MTLSINAPQSITAPAAPRLTAADRKLFRGTAAEIQPWMSTTEILQAIGCDFRVVRRPAESMGRTYGDCQLWLRNDTQDMLGFFGTKRQIIQPHVFIDYFRSFCDSSGKAISLDVIGSYNQGRTLYMGAKLTDNSSCLLDANLGGAYGAGGGMNISRPGSSAYIPTEDRTDHWLILTESFGESLRPRVMVIANELICSNSLSRRVTECEVKLSHSACMNSDAVHAVLGQAMRQCQAYSRVKERLIETPISMETARSALRAYFGDSEGQSRIVQRLEAIYQSDLIGDDLETRTDNAWRLASAVTQYTSHERIGRADATFRSQLEGARARTANNFLAFLEQQFADGLAGTLATA